ncbi:unnamed protein product [Linum trigynum]|uniref:UBN2 domain-containing protein n=1 Tax=Linum trigynum TaxID=586398 RepID=A0AAV2E696_9ROSI
MFAASVPVSLHSQVTSVVKFNGLNFYEWAEQVQFHLCVLDLDLALLSEKPAALTDASSAEEKSFHKAWERSNRLSLMFMRMTVANNIKSTFNDTESAKEFMNSVKESSQSESTDKSLAGTLMGTRTTMKFDGSRTMHEHIVEMTNIAARLKTMGMEVNENFLVTFILNSLPPEYGTFHVHYNTLKDKWNVHELQSMLIQEEARLKKPRNHSANLVGHKGDGKKPWNKNGKGKEELSKLNESSAKIHKKEPSKDICRFCKKAGHYQKD